MLNKSRAIDTQALLARQIGHLIRAGRSYDDAFKTLRAAADGELTREIDELRRYLDQDGPAGFPERRFASAMPALAQLVGIARRRGADPAAVLSRAEEVLGPLGENHRVYWAGIGGFMWYALALMVLVFVVLIVFSVFVFPQIDALFEGSENAMPALTVFVMTTLRSLTALFFFLIASGVIALVVAAHKIRNAMKRLEPLRGVVTRIPGLASLCDGYNTALFLNFTRLLTFAGVVAGDALDDASRMQWPGKAVFSEAASAASGRLDGLLRTDPVSGGLMLALRAGTLADEIGHQSARSQALFAETLARVREEFTLVAQVFVGIVIATLVISMYLPIFKMGMIF